jgi:hypothetical protein
MLLVSSKKEKEKASNQRRKGLCQTSLAFMEITAFHSNESAFEP